ncbi:MAG: anhydro-N-acetylmuramic acid kinase, partial [Alphaproteobacteria bacterium]|nr:anhydro-N-acetylmuramic acid kinase [Alphaproteobacteria bacterium]
MPKMLTSIGLMSGTSLDGIDVALVTTDGDERVARGAFRTYAYDTRARAMLRQAIADARSLRNREDRPGSLAVCERELTAWHADAVRRFCYETGTSLTSVDVIGFHGQTVLHRPEAALTVQIGDGPGLAHSLGRSVVFDLRAADMEAGGQGAPLVPVYHRALATMLGARPMAMVNIGGVANLTGIGADGNLIAFDTGPGNALINDWCERHLGEAMDRGGALAASGHADRKVLAALMENEYFKRPPPKSLDRDAFDVSGL